MKETISRRDFLKIGSLATAGIALLGAQYYLNLGNFFSLPEIEKAPRYPLPEALRGVSVNSPFIWRLEQSQDEVLRKARTYRPATMRLFGDDTIEPSLGTYSTTSLKRFQSFVNKVDKMKEETGWAPGLTVDFGDSYGMLPRSSPVYGDSKAFSPYSDGSDKGYRDFFGPEKRKLYKKRMKTMSEAIGGSKAVVAWGIANEASPPAGPDGQAVLTDWMADMVGECRRLDPERPILTGLAHPWEIDEGQIDDRNTVNTIHVYPFNPGLTLDPFRQYLASPNRKMPLYPQEVGFPNRLLGRDFPPDFIDKGYGMIVQGVLRYATIGGRLETNGIGLWKMDGYDDGFPDPFMLPHTKEMLAGCAQVLK